MTPDPGGGARCEAVAAVNTRISVEFSAERRVPWHPAFLARSAKEGVKGRRLAIISDTVEFTRLPELFRSVHPRYPHTRVPNSDKAIWSCTATMTSAWRPRIRFRASWSAACRQLECTVWRGERAGNCALEESRWRWCGPDYFKLETRINTKKRNIADFKLVSSVTGFPVQPNKGDRRRAERFLTRPAHSPGRRHQARQTYEIMQAERCRPVEGPHRVELSSRNAFKQHVRSSAFR